MWFWWGPALQISKRGCRLTERENSPFQEIRYSLRLSPAGSENLAPLDRIRFFRDRRCRWTARVPGMWSPRGQKTESVWQ